MIRETVTFVLPTGDKASVEIIEGNHGVTCVIPDINLVHAIISPTLFQEVIDHIVSLNRPYIKKIYFDNVKITYKFISIQLFGHIRGALKKELRRPLKFSELISGKDDYKWVEANFLPKFQDEFETDIHNLERRIKNMYWAFKKGKMKKIPYVLHDDYEIVYNYFFDIDPTDIKPVFEVYVRTKFPKTEGNLEQVSQMLLGKFKSLGVDLIFVGT